MQTTYVEQIPIPEAPKRLELRVSRIVQQILERQTKDPSDFVKDLDVQNDGLVAYLYGLTEDEYRLILDDLALPDPVRVGALNAYRETALTLTK